VTCGRKERDERRDKMIVKEKENTKGRGQGGTGKNRKIKSFKNPALFALPIGMLF
jgi:hypothetical protein